MKHLLKDVLKTDYSLLVHCPFIKQADLRVIVGKEYGCKAIEHTKLLSVIDNEWNFVEFIIFYHCRCYNNVLIYSINQNTAIIMVISMVFAQCILD